MLGAGYHDEAIAWRDWLLRAIAGRASELQILYGIQGERRLNEVELPWLTGYEKSTPVRVGNAAAAQFQLDVYGEVLDCLYQARCAGIAPEEASWRMEIQLLEFLESKWMEPDEGIWEVRGGRRQFTHSKVMAWVAADRAVKSIEAFHLEGDARRWKALRQTIHDEVCRKGYNASRDSFTQVYGSDALDASLLMIPLVGFLPIDDPRVRGTIAAIERELMTGGFVYRYHPEASSSVDGLPPGEGVFLPCSFWMADCLNLAGRRAEAIGLFERLLALRNDLGLLSEEYDPEARRMAGNFPQAFSHVGLVNTARNLCANGPATHRCR
jgi:GH15 family glucan-1,4-alpha-glucosidase